MNIYPVNLPAQLDFDFIIEKLTTFCFGKEARKMCEQIKPQVAYAHILQLLSETNEILMSIQRADNFIPTAYPEIEKELQLLHIEQTVLTSFQFHQIRQMIVLVHELIQYLSDKEDVYPFIYRIVSPHVPAQQVLDYINDIINPEGIVKDNASITLAQLRKQLQENRSLADRIYRNHIQRLKKNGQLADIEESFINGRRVLAVLAEYKREVKGIIVSQSSTGRIAFIEPQNVVEINNERIDIEAQEKKEIYRILQQLTAVIQPFASILQSFFKLLSYTDFVLAKAKLALALKATQPILHQHAAQTILYNAYHPVLFLQHAIKNEPVVPLQCAFTAQQRVMVISGPNAGGKSITLKTIGLLQLMLQCGLLIPVAANSEFSIQHQLFGDIGDNQSIEDGLSTYSSRLQKMKFFLQKTNKRTLFLIDEFGTGSDPDMGGAMAEVILHKLNETHAFGVVTTHFTNLKLLANQHEGIFNACMLFNSKSLKPLYQLHIGEPGSSFTFEVAQKIGLPTEIIDEAKRKLSREKLKMDKLLSQLQVEKNNLEKLKRDLKKQMGKTTAEKREFQELNDKLEVTLEQTREQKEETQKLIDYGKKLHLLTREWTEKKDKKPIIQKFVKLAGFELAKKKEQEALEKTAAYKQQKIQQLKDKLTTGASVRMLKSKEIGIVKNIINQQRAEVQFGKVIIQVGIEKLELVHVTTKKTNSGLQQK